MNHAHYVALFLWVLANLVWAAGELWDPNVDDPIYLLDAKPEALRTARWYSSWILVVAYLPIVVMYYMWVYAYITAPDTLIEDDDDQQLPTHNKSDSQTSNDKVKLELPSSVTVVDGLSLTTKERVQPARIVAGPSVSSNTNKKSASTLNGSIAANRNGYQSIESQEDASVPSV